MYCPSVFNIHQSNLTPNTMNLKPRPVAKICIFQHFLPQSLFLRRLIYQRSRDQFWEDEPFNFKPNAEGQASTRPSDSSLFSHIEEKKYISSDLHAHTDDERSHYKDRGRDTKE